MVRLGTLLGALGVTWRKQRAGMRMFLVGLSQSRTGSGRPDQALWQWRPGPGMHGDSGAFESGKIPPGQSACPLDRSRHRPLEHVRVEAESSRLHPDMDGWIVDSSSYFTRWPRHLKVSAARTPPTTVQTPSTIATVPRSQVPPGSADAKDSGRNTKRRPLAIHSRGKA